MLPAIMKDPYCCKPGCPNPGRFVEIVTGIGRDPITGEELRRARVLCVWHGSQHMPLAEYQEALAGQRVKEALLARAEPTALKQLRDMARLATWGTRFTPRKTRGV